MWTPLLDGERACAAREARDEIVAALAALAPERWGGADLARGRAGHALLLVETGRADEAEPILDAILEAHLAAPRLELYGGVLGPAWLLAREAGDACADIDDTLLEMVDEPRSVELMNGLAGWVVYAAERRSAGRELLARIARVLDRAAERDDHGRFWRDLDGSLRLSMPHGTPGVIGALATIQTSGAADASALLDDALRWLWAQQVPGGTAFPTLARSRVAARTAWCYGDPGIAVAIYRAGCALGDPAWRARGLDVMRRAAQRPFEDCGVVDAGVCHGAAGLAHLFHWMYRASGEPVFAEAARRWIDRTLQCRTRDGGLAGFRAWDLGANGFEWTDAPGFLVGVVGIGLVLHAAVGPDGPRWDSVMVGGNCT